MPNLVFVIPVFNDVGYLAATLASLVAQTLPAWTAIVVDDGSAVAAGAALVVQRVGDPRVSLLRLDRNRGPAAARNAGIRATTAELIVTVDADDLLSPTYLVRVMPFLGHESPYNCVFTDHQYFGAVTSLARPVRLDLPSLLRWQWIPQSGVAIRRSLWERVGGYPEDEALRVGDEDRDFWISAMDHGLTPKYLPEPLVQVRVGHASLTARLNQEAWRTHRVIVDRHPALYRRYGGTRSFLADGYVTSAEAVRAAGDRRKAIRLALGALRHEPWRITAFGVIGRALLPPTLHRALRRLRGRAESRTP